MSAQDGSEYNNRLIINTVNIRTIYILYDKYIQTLEYIRAYMRCVSTKTVVLVTGASGFIATHVVKLLQVEGYKVRGTVRSLQNEEKVAPLRNLCPGAKHPLELVEANLMNPESWDK